MKRLKLLYLLIALCFFSIISVYAEGGVQRVFDEAELLNETEIETLESKIQQQQNQINADIAIITTNDTMGMTTFQFLDYIYDREQIGFGPDRDGVLFVIDMDNREVDLITDGKMIDQLTNIRIDSILDDAFNAIVEGDYFATSIAFLEGVTYYLVQENNQEELPAIEPETEEEPIILEQEEIEEESDGNIFTMALIAGAVGLAFNGIVRVSYKSAQPSNSVLKGESQLSLKSQHDKFSTSRVTKTRRPKDPPKEEKNNKNQSRNNKITTNSKNTKRSQPFKSYDRAYYSDDCRRERKDTYPQSNNESNRGGGRGRNF